MLPDSVLQRMSGLIVDWEDRADRRAVFLRCYRMMTQNMLEAIPVGAFVDAVWVDRLLHAFAAYYFVALEEYQASAKAAPAVWQVAHDAACAGRSTTLQMMLLGVNAHINYDLVLTLVELLDDEWPTLSETGRAHRHADYSKVNDIIAGTIDAVQDQILEPAMPWMELVDRAFGSADERMISSLISSWRETVWRDAVQLLQTSDPQERRAIIQQVEQLALRRASAIELKDWGAVIGALF